MAVANRRVRTCTTACCTARSSKVRKVKLRPVTIWSLASSFFPESFALCVCVCDVRISRTVRCSMADGSCGDLGRYGSIVRILLFTVPRRMFYLACKIKHRNLSLSHIFFFPRRLILPKISFSETPPTTCRNVPLLPQWTTQLILQRHHHHHSTKHFQDPSLKVVTPPPPTTTTTAKTTANNKVKQ